MENVSNCSLPTGEVYIIYAVLGATASVSVLCCMCVLFLSLIFKRYRFMAQRMVLYVAVTVLLYELVQLLHIGDHANQNNAYCVVTGFLDQQIGWYELLAISCLTFDLLTKAVYKLDTRKYELVYLFIIFILPFGFDWIPFVTGDYGLARATCWIKSVNISDCSKSDSGIILRFVLYWAEFFVIMVIIAIAYVVVTVMVWRKKRSYEGIYDPSQQKRIELLEREIRLYLWYPLVFLAWNIVPTVVRVIEATNPTQTYFELRVVHIVFIGLQGAVISLTFAMDYDIWRQVLKPRRLRAAVVSCCFAKRNEPQEYHMTLDPQLTDSLPRHINSS